MAIRRLVGNIRSEAIETLKESERPLGYAATVITVYLGSTAGLSWALTLLGIPLTTAVPLGVTSTMAVLLAYILAFSLRRSARIRKEQDSKSQVMESLRQQLAEVTKNATEQEALQSKSASELRDQLAEAVRLHREVEAKLGQEREAFSRELTKTRTSANEGLAAAKSSVEAELYREQAQRKLLEQRLTEAERAIEAERTSTERTKVAPLIDPYSRSAVIPGGLRHTIGAWNRGKGPAEDVTFEVTFRDDSGSWTPDSTPLFSVLEPGKRVEYAVNTADSRKPTGFDLTVTFKDAFGTERKKEIGFTLRL